MSRSRRWPQTQAWENNLNHCYLLRLNVDIYLGRADAETQQLSIKAHGNRRHDKASCAVETLQGVDSISVSGIDLLFHLQKVVKKQKKDAAKNSHQMLYYGLESKLIMTNLLHHINKCHHGGQQNST